MECPNCGEEISEEDSVCPHCGALIEEPACGAIARAKLGDVLRVNIAWEFAHA